MFSILLVGYLYPVRQRETCPRENGICSTAKPTQLFDLPQVFSERSVLRCSGADDCRLTFPLTGQQLSPRIVQWMPGRTLVSPRIALNRGGWCFHLPLASAVKI